MGSDAYAHTLPRSQFSKGLEASAAGSTVSRKPLTFSPLKDCLSCRNVHCSSSWPIQPLRWKGMKARPFQPNAKQSGWDNFSSRTFCGVGQHCHQAWFTAQILLLAILLLSLFFVRCLLQRLFLWNILHTKFYFKVCFSDSLGMRGSQKTHDIDKGCNKIL